MPLSLTLSPHGRLFVEELPEASETGLAAAVSARIQAAFAASAGHGLLHLAAVELTTVLPPALVFWREFAHGYLTRLCHTPDLDGANRDTTLPFPAEYATRADQAPPMRGLEYLSAEVLAGLWAELDAFTRGQMRSHPAGPSAYLKTLNPAWHLVGRVTFHLAENKKDAEAPFAFMATYTSRLSAQAKPQYVPLGRALQDYAGTQNRDALLSLLAPVQLAAEKSPFIRQLADNGAIYHPQRWTPQEAYRFLKDIPVFEDSGVIVRVPDWWKPGNPARPRVTVRVGENKTSRLDADTLLSFSLSVTLNGEELTAEELAAIQAQSQGLALLKGRWVEIDRDKLSSVLDHWKQVQKTAGGDGISFLAGMRLLAGAGLEKDEAQAVDATAHDWSKVLPGDWLESVLRNLRQPQELPESVAVPGLRAELRPYQKTGVGWLHFMQTLGLGACLADDMGLGKTVQVLALLLRLRHGSAQAAPPAEAAAAGVSPGTPAPAPGERLPSLLVAPASLLGNWRAEIDKFAPSLKAVFLHPAETDRATLETIAANPAAALTDTDLVITTYGMAARLDWLKNIKWHLAVLDEAQAIKNPQTRQARATKQLQARCRMALTGTPVENRLGDLWSLFDYLNPGLLGNAAAFNGYAKAMAAATTPNAYAPLRNLVRPYILRRLKTDKAVIADLPDKTELNAYCSLTKSQAVLYQQAVSELQKKLDTLSGIERRGLILAYIMRFKQICNHPAQLLGTGAYDPAASGKFQRLLELCGDMAERQEKVLVFTQFREMTDPLAQALTGAFGRSGLVLHGGTAVGDRRKLVDHFQRDDGPPFFVLSLKAGGTGLNLTAACQVIHFDRWWNPAVENQATDRAFRIGQKQNVLVHKFVCRGTIEDRIDALITEKKGLAEDLLEGGAATRLTEMSNQELLAFVALDLGRAMEE